MMGNRFLNIDNICDNLISKNSKLLFGSLFVVIVVVEIKEKKSNSK